MSTPALPTSASPNPALQALLQHPALWRARSLNALSGARLLPALQPTLAALLPGGGWPRGQITEVLLAQPGLGELSLFLPILASQTQNRHWCACVNTPAGLYAPVLNKTAKDIIECRLYDQFVFNRTTGKPLYQLDGNAGAGLANGLPRSMRSTGFSLHKD